MATAIATTPFTVTTDRSASTTTVADSPRRFDAVSAAVIVGGSALAVGSFAWIAWAMSQIHITI